MRNDFSSNYLAHHGILGQKWGHKNGPPYPLDVKDHSSAEKKAGWAKSLADSYKNRKKKKQQRKNLEKARIARAKKAEEKRQAAAKEAEEKKKAEEFAKEKERILRSGNPKEILAYKDQLTDQEIQSALNRIRNERDIKDFARQSEKSGFDKINSFMGKAEKAYNWAQTGIKWYNVTASLYNTFLSDGPEYNWKKINMGGGDKKKK